MWCQKEFRLSPKPRGIHLITKEVLKELPEIRKTEIGLLHLFLKHTSASLSLGENADPDVRHDLEAWLNQVAPENEPYFRHTMEGSDDMPAHLKSHLLGVHLSLPVFRGSLNLGIWQGIYLCEHRNRASARCLVATLHGK